MPPSIGRRSWHARSATPSSTRRQPFIVDTAVRDPDVVARATSAASSSSTSSLDSSSTSSRRCVPFLRWDPVPPPAIVSLTPLHRRRVAAPARRPLGRHPGSRHARDHGRAPRRLRAGARAPRLSRRQRAAPRAAQDEPERAELHGAFDDAIGSTDPADHETLLAVAATRGGDAVRRRRAPARRPDRSAIRSRASTSSPVPRCRSSN